MNGGALLTETITYLQSRYYNPTTGRFLNADGYTSTGQGLLGNNMFAYCLNNPVNLLDKNGNQATALKLWLTAGLSLTAIDGILPFGDIAYAAGIVITGAMVLGQSSSSAKKEVTTQATTATKTTTPSGPYSVYFLRAQGDSSNKIIYVGRVKTDNFTSRMSYHRGKGRELVNYIDGLSYEACRGIEQAGMMYHHTINRQNSLNNQIRGISPHNVKRTSYFSAAFAYSQYQESVYLPSSYWENLTENEFLNAGM